MFRIPNRYMNWDVSLKRNKRYPIILPYTLYWLYRLLKGNIYAETLFIDKNRIPWDNEYLRHNKAINGKRCYEILSYEIMNIKGKDQIVIWIDPNCELINF